MSYLVLVDGPKTPERSQLAASLAFELHAYHDVGRMSTLPETYVRMMQPAIDMQRNVVIECSWITQRHHASMLPAEERRVFALWAAQRRMLDRLALGCSGVAVLLLDPEHELHSHWDSEALGDWAVPRVIVNKPKVELAVAATIPFLERQLVNLGPGIGRWNPGQVVLLIGDQHGDTVQPYDVQRNIAFCSMSGIGCSEWLTNHLEAHGINERQLYWINAKIPGGQSTTRQFLYDLKPLHIIALGQMAALWCKKIDPPYVTIPHPQYWKRFHSKEPYELGPLLQEALDGGKEERAREDSASAREHDQSSYYP